MASPCSHLDMINTNLAPSDVHECAECIKQGTTWVHLRRCLTCGFIGCCDSSEQQHARKHFQDSDHPIIQSQEPNEDWRWCYKDDMYI